MAIKPAINQFNGGELSPYLEGRTDWDKYNYSAKLCKNFIPLIEGSLKRRGGSHFVGKVKAKESYNIQFTVKVKGDAVPNVVLNGVIVEQLDVRQEGEYTTYTTSQTYNEGQLVTVYITAEGYRDVNDTFNAPSAPKEYVLREISEEIIEATLTVIKASDDIALRLNGANTNRYTTNVEDPIIWTAVYNENNASGSIYIDKDTVVVLNIIDNTPVLILEGDSIISTDNPRSGEIILATGVYRVTAVGAGGPAIIGGSETTPNYYNGGAGGLVYADFKLDKGVYNWQVGKISEKAAYSLWDLRAVEKPEPTFLNYGSVEIANAGGGGINNYSTVSYNTDKAQKVYSAQKGAIGTKPGGGQTKSGVGDYGSGSYLTSFKTEGNYWVFSYEPATNGFLAITYIGA